MYQKNFTKLINIYLQINYIRIFAFVWKYYEVNDKAKGLTDNRLTTKDKMSMLSSLIWHPPPPPAKAI